MGTGRTWAAIALAVLLFSHTIIAEEKQNFTARTLSALYDIKKGQQELTPGQVEFTPGATHQGNYFKLLRAAHALGFRVIVVDFVKDNIFPQDFLSPAEIEGLWGYNLGVEGKQKTILLSLRLNGNTLVNTLAHEIAHGMQPKVLNGKPASQVFAQAVADVYCLNIGMVLDNSGFNYMAQFDQPTGTIDQYAAEIDEAVRFLLREGQ